MSKKRVKKGLGMLGIRTPVTQDQGDFERSELKLAAGEI